MMLRTRNTNVPQQNNGAAPQKRQARNNTKAQALIIEDAMDTSMGEPKAKKQALSDHSQLGLVLSGVVLDSAKKPKGNAKGGQKRFGLRTIETNSTAIKTGVDRKPTVRSVLASVPDFDPCPEYDYDKENIRDVAAVSDYAVDIFRYYKRRERQFKINNYFGETQPHLNEEVRATLIDWLVEVQEQFELNHETLYLAVKLMDTYLERVPGVLPCRLQLIASAALFLAAKYDERSAPLIDDFLYMADDSFNRDEFLQMERDLFRVIGFDLGAPISYRFLRRFARVNKTDMATLTLARYILEISLMFLDFCRVSESLMAAASLMLALRMKKQQPWSLPLWKYSGYEAKDVEPLMWALNHMMVRREDHYPQMQIIVNKYSHAVFYEVSMMQPLADALPNNAPIAPPAELLPRRRSASVASGAPQKRRR
ncbi:Protein CYB-3 a [Aphelenchoides avenae]|nr:Protein CYB-3 a [Aphelenchus avenae]